LALVRDLIFATKISSTAGALGRPVKMIRDPFKLAGEVGQRLIVDLNLSGALEAAIHWKAATGGEVVGFVSHVDANTIRAAREGGIDRVMARSEFVRVLPELLGTETAPQVSYGETGEAPPIH
jgi:hypothetical protein